MWYVFWMISGSSRVVIAGTFFLPLIPPYPVLSSQLEDRSEIRAPGGYLQRSAAKMQVDAPERYRSGIQARKSPSLPSHSLMVSNPSRRPNMRRPSTLR